MNIRQQIIEKLDKPVNLDSMLFNDLQDTLIIDYDKNQFSEVQDGLRLFFKGCIESLFYRPNKTVLVLVGPQAIGKTVWINRLFPDILDFKMYQKIYSGDKYNSPLLFVEFTKKNLSISMKDDFVINQLEGPFEPPTIRTAECDKRLASYVSTSNHWVYPQRKDFSVIYLKSIDWDLYNSIDKTELWIELFNTYKIVR